MGWKVADYKDYNGPGEWESGVLTVPLQSWKDFSSGVAHLDELGAFIWRGQRQDWPLLSKFQRDVKGNHTKILTEHTRTFRNAIKGRRGNNPPPLNNDIAVWKLGQHYGLPTPLLDWTESPFVAAYFAYWEDGSEDEDKPYRFVYGLSKDITRWGPVKSSEDKLEKRYVYVSDECSDENARMINQRGLFTLTSAADIEIEQVVRLCYSDDEEKGVKRIILVKIQIPSTDRNQCLRELNRMNINHATLFPDLAGAAVYCTMKLKSTDY
ncbi:MAG: FRG domain-containing protein [Planctomycetota bacterium]|jgi:hypothetical protein